MPVLRQIDGEIRHGDGEGRRKTPLEHGGLGGVAGAVRALCGMRGPAGEIRPGIAV